MSTQQKYNIIFFSSYGSLLAFAVLEIVVLHSFRMLTTFGIIVGFSILIYPLDRYLTSWARDFKKLAESLPADHKLITRNIATVDIGNFRFIYRVYEKGSGINPLSKSYVSLEVGIPYPEGDSARDSIRSDLQHLIDDLREEDLLTEYNPLVNDNVRRDSAEDSAEINWIGFPFRLEFLLKSITPARMTRLQETITGIIDKYQLQELSWCTIRGARYGTEYLYHKGNLLQSTVLIRGVFDRIRSDYKRIAELYTTDYDSPYIRVDEYHELYKLASKSLGKDNWHVSDIKVAVKQMFKKKKNLVARIYDYSDVFSVNITIPKLKAASTYHLINSGDRWWIFSEGRLENLSPISTDDESSASDLFLRILQRFVG